MKIAIVKLSALGDIVHAMIVLQFIKKYNKDVKIDWIVEECYKELLESHPDINKVFLVNLKKSKKKKSLFLFFKELKKVRQFGSYDLVIDMQGLVKSALIARLISSKITLGFDKESIRESLASIFYNQTFNFPYENNVIERNISLTASVLMAIDIQDIKNKIPFLFSSQKYFFNSISKIKNNILLIPGASYKAKCYPIEKLKELTRKIDANFLIIWGNEVEKNLANKVKDSSSKIIVMDKLSIDSLISLISQVDLVIGPDTGPTHMAWALNIPSISLFGPTPGLRNTCVTKINKIIESDSDVNPNKINKSDYSIINIKVDEIVDVAKDLLLIDNKS